MNGNGIATLEEETQRFNFKRIIFPNTDNKTQKPNKTQHTNVVTHRQC